MANTCFLDNLRIAIKVGHALRLYRNNLLYLLSLDCMLRAIFLFPFLEGEIGKLEKKFGHIPSCSSLTFIVFLFDFAKRELI